VGGGSRRSASLVSESIPLLAHRKRVGARTHARMHARTRARASTQVSNLVSVCATSTTAMLRRLAVSDVLHGCV
jgi:hypothetical protein